MNKQQVLEAVKLAREFSKKRNFNQTFDVVINLKDLNVKKTDENVDTFVVLPNKKGKPIKICALVDKDLTEKAKVFDKVILKSDFIIYKKPKQIKQLASEYDFFMAQATIMTDIAKTFGKVLGARGKMPNPKAGCILTPASDFNLLKQRLQKTVRLKTINEPIIKAGVGMEDMTDEEIVDNLIVLYNSLVHSLPNEEENVRDVHLKLTMGAAVKVGEKKEEVQARLDSKKEKPKQAPQPKKQKQTQPKQKQTQPTQPAEHEESQKQSQEPQSKTEKEPQTPAEEEKPKEKIQGEGKKETEGEGKPKKDERSESVSDNKKKQTEEGREK